GIATLVSVVGFLVVCLTDHPSAIDRVETIWWVVLGVATAVQVPKVLTGAARARPACDDEYVGSIGPAMPPSTRRAPAQVPIATTLKARVHLGSMTSEARCLPWFAG